MVWRDWDNEIDHLAKDLALMRIGKDGRCVPSLYILNRRRIAIVQLQANIDRKLEKIKRICARNMLLLPRDHTIVHWGGFFCDAVGKLLAVSTATSHKKLWLKLIRIRLGEPGEKATLSHLEPDELVELALRKADLAKTERALSKTLISLDEQRRQLFERYEQLEIKRTMADASGSLPSRLGADVTDAFSGPTMVALANLMHGVFAVETNAAPQRRAWRRMERQSEKLMQMAQRLAFGLAKGRSPSLRHKERFRRMLTKLNALDVETRGEASPVSYRLSTAPIKFSQTKAKLSDAYVVDKR